MSTLKFKIYAASHPAVKQNAFSDECNLPLVSDVNDLTDDQLRLVLDKIIPVAHSIEAIDRDSHIVELKSIQGNIAFLRFANSYVNCSGENALVFYSCGVCDEWRAKILNNISSNRAVIN